ncbi:hypothetical protein HU200_050331 [Digitaria exilis]|uniref:Uncharacterized protein n=1 Tax=Digitaria exilis TaxID=1010633 RepID=A0A835AXL2_9POAL|nr:hypothetical protein HU200_050331 [Digitaria exilis]
METLSFVTPISGGNHKSYKNLLPPLFEGTVDCQAVDSDIVGSRARVEGAVLCDVKLTVHGNFEGHGLPLSFLTSKSTGKPVMGYPITVEVLEDGYSTEIIAAQQLAALTGYSRVEIK